MLFEDWLSMCVHACVHLHICSLRVVHRHQRRVLLVCRALMHATWRAPVPLAEWSWCEKASPSGAVRALMRHQVLEALITS